MVRWRHRKDSEQDMLDPGNGILLEAEEPLVGARQQRIMIIEPTRPERQEET
jgi:hypothetical protein